MNSNYSYKYQELWDERTWKKRISKIYPLITYIGECAIPDYSAYPTPYEEKFGEEAKKLPFYTRKTNCVELPEVILSLHAKGITFDCRSQGGINWFILAPSYCLADFTKKLITILVILREDITDPYWAMKILRRYESYLNLITEDEGCIFYFLAGDTPDYNRIYVNILQEAFVFVPGDINRLFLDVSMLVNNGKAFNEIPSYVLEDLSGTPFWGADSCILRFGSLGIPVLDISHRWENLCSLSRDQISMPNWSSEGFDLERIIHSETGRKIAEGMALEFKYNTTFDPGFLSYWEAMGLAFVNRETKNHRWKVAIPLQAFSQPEIKLPVMCLFQEVNHSNEHLAVTATSYFYEFFRIAAQGECIVLCFVLEDHEGNELLCDVLNDALASYPMMDMSRVYLAGHSHNGYYSLEFALRHPNLIAAVATFGDVPGLWDSPLFPVNEKRIQRMASLDIPTINLTGCNEPKRHFPMNTDGYSYRPQHVNSPMKSFEERLESWQQRLRAYNCPPVTATSMRETHHNKDKAIRVLGIPADKSETLWMDGFELYIADIRNNEGLYHLRIVGEENMPHNTTPSQQILAWSFLRRFTRDANTLKIQELY